MSATHDLLFEIGCEEIPSRFLPGAMEQFKKAAASLLLEYRLGHGQIEAWSTPRRLVLKVNSLDQEQPDLVEQVKGPPVNRAYDEEGKPTRALEGFMQGQGVTVDQLKEETVKDALYIFVEKETSGRPAADLLPELLPKLIQKLSFPRPMYWKNKEIRFARPIRWLLALYSNRPVHFSYAGIDSGRSTRGHRFLSPGPFDVDSPEHYFRTLEENYIVVDHNRRREIIREQLIQKAEENGGIALIDDDLLEEVTFLVEYPVAVDGSFDPAYLDLPQEVPITSMQNHQRYFPIVEKESGRLMPYFVGISNNRFNENIRKGYAKVLQARLADGRFFFNEDRKEPLEKYVDKLKTVIFLESLGSLDQKRARLVELTGLLASALNLPVDKKELAERAAHLCKADLVTNMVKEFPELQGVMGREYAKLSGEAAEVALAIYEHYQPKYTGDILPSSTEGALVSLADRLDTLAGCFAVGIQPTSSQDPYGLRRQAQGVISILQGLEIETSIEDCLAMALQALSLTLDIDEQKSLELQSVLREFLLQRIRFSLQESGVEHDVIEAVLAVPFGSIPGLFRKASVLEEFLKGPLLDEVITAYNRVANLAQKAEGIYVDKKLFEDISEKELYRTLQAVENSLKSMNDPAQRLEKLQVLKQPIDHFFDNVMVMVEDEKLRNNRLNMLAALKATFNRMADFSKLQSP
jgi:glycyl-tRNA synthetase beta chain